MSFPVVRLDAIPPQGLVVQVGEWAVAASAEAMEGTIQALSGELKVVRSGPHLLTGGHVEATALVRCDRCAELLALTVSGRFSCLYSPVDALPEVDEHGDVNLALPDSWTDGVQEVSEYDGEAIDLSHVVAEFLAVERPSRVRCADLDPAADAACAARWKAGAGSSGPAAPGAFATLKDWKPRT